MMRSRKVMIGLILTGVLLVFAIGAGIFIGLDKLPALLDHQQSADDNALKLPPLLQDEDPDPGSASFTLNAQTGTTNFLGDKITATMGYNGAFLGPVLRMKQGERVSIRVNNNLDSATTVHWHGLVVSGEQDGGPHQVIQPGQSWNPTFTVDQPAATLWYHPHAMDTTATQVYAGLAGLIYIDDANSTNLNIPKDYGVNDFPLIVQDRNFNSDGSFSHQTSMMGVVPGNTILVNGSIHPYLNVGKVKVRFRLLNASNSENYLFKLSDGSDFLQIASDGGFLASPLARQSIALSPGERAEVIIDFTRIRRKSVELLLGNQSILDFRLGSDNAGNAIKDQTVLPSVLATIPVIPVDENPVIRVFELQSMGISGTINGKAFDMNRIDEEVRQNEAEVWVIRNRGGMMMQSGGHPFHVHGTQFQVISRNGQAPPPEEQGFKDTIFVAVGEEVQIRIRFSLPGVYMYHCHILEHEENGMMGQILVTP